MSGADNHATFMYLLSKNSDLLELSVPVQFCIGVCFYSKHKYKYAVRIFLIEVTTCHPKLYEMSKTSFKLELMW